MRACEREDAGRRLQERLDALLVGFPVEARRQGDPVAIVHEYEAAEDREIAALVASSCAFGQAQVAQQRARALLARLGDSPARGAAELLRTNQLRDCFSGWGHRMYQGAMMADLVGHAVKIQHRDGSLGRCFERLLRLARGDLREGLARFADELRGAAPALTHVVPDPRRGSACKRLLLFLRWMCRPCDGVDLGLWSVPPRLLVIPVDTHVHRITRNLGLTRRLQASWQAAQEITERLKAFDPEDPVKYDFALCHMGISRDCPSRLDLSRCSHCVLLDVCEAAVKPGSNGRSR